MPDPYLVTSTIRHTRRVHRRFSRTVHRVPFQGNPRFRTQYYDQIRLLLVHLEHNAVYFKRYGYFVEDRWVPLSWTHVSVKLPRVFGPNRGATERAINLMCGPAGPLEVLPYRTGSLCRRYRVCADVRRGWYRTERAVLSTTTLASYRELNRGYDLARPGLRKPQGGWNHEIGQALARGIQVPRLDVSALRRSPEAQRRYRAAYAQMEPNEVCLDVLLHALWMMERWTCADPVEEDRRISRMLQLNSSVSAMLSSGVEAVPGRDLTVRYRPRYHISPVGGRGFEDGGFQTLSGGLKLASSHLDNYDISSSQFNILRTLLKQYGVGCPMLRLFKDLGEVALQLAISRRHVKSLFYGLVFNAGHYVNGRYNSSWRDLHLHYPGRADGIRLEWQRLSLDLSNAIKLLVDRIWATAQPGTHPSWGAPTGIRYVATADNRRARRQLLSHTIQSIESDYILQVMEDPRNRVCSQEHDGFMGYLGASPDSQLRLERKQENRKRLRAQVLDTRTYPELLEALGKRL